MSEFKKEIGVAAAIAIIAALGVGVVAITSFPTGLGHNSTTVSTSSIGVVTLGAQPLAGALSGENASCSLASGICTFTVVNNSTAPFDLVGCQTQVIGGVEVTTTTLSAASSESATTTYITFANGSSSTVVSTPTNSIASASVITQTATEYLNINGTMGGPATAGIPASSQVTMTCTFPTTQLAQQPVGSQASGSVWVKLASSWDSYPAGTQTSFGFEGVWS